MAGVSVAAALPLAFGSASQAERVKPSALQIHVASDKLKGKTEGPGSFAMPATENRRSPEEVARLGAEVFDRRVQPVLGDEDDGKFVAIDVGTGDYELDEDDYAAVMRLRDRRPSADVWLGRVGQPAAYRMRRYP